MDHYKLNQIVQAEVISLRPYGALLSVNNDCKGLLHISEISSFYVADINDFLFLGEKVDVQIIDIDEKTGFLKFSLKSISDKPPKTHRRFRHEKIDEKEIDFTPLKEMLPLWIERAKEQKND